MFCVPPCCTGTGLETPPSEGVLRAAPSPAGNPPTARRARAPNVLSFQLKPAGTACRGAGNSCDLPEFCSGASPHCPANVYLHDGHPCQGVDGYCYNGICQTHEQQCVTLWGPGTGRCQLGSGWGQGASLRGFAPWRGRGPRAQGASRAG